MPTKVPLHNSNATIPTDAISVVPKDPAEVIRVTIFVRRPEWNGYTVETYADSVIAGINPVLTRDEFKQKFRASDADLAAVAAFAQTAGVTVLGQYNSSAAVELEGTVAEFNSLFDIVLQTVTTEKTVYTCYNGDLYVDTDLDDIITLVDGLDQTLAAQIQRQSPVPKPGSTPFVTPQAIADVYNFPGLNDGNDGTGQIVAILQPFGLFGGGGYNAQNLTSTFNDVYGVSTPTMVARTLNGTTNNPTGPYSGECMLDIAMVGGIVPKATIIVVFCTQYTTALTDLLNNVSGVGIPSVISISAANLEAPPGPGGSPLQNQTDTLLAQCAAQGITVCVASGDWGPYTGPLTDGNTAWGACWPASSPYVVAVGATTLIANDGVWASEVAWNNSEDYYITGGNFSIRYAVPTWQNGLSYTTFPGNTTVTLTSGSLTATQGRCIPDVSLNGDPYCGYSFYVTNSSGQNTLVQSGGGSSASAPLWAGLVARQNQIAGSARGFVNATYYANPNDFRDIVSGNNWNPAGPSQQGYLTTAGWDMTTGLGSFMGEEPTPPTTVPIYIGAGVTIGAGITFD